MRDLPAPTVPVLTALPVMLYAVALVFWDLRGFPAAALVGLLLTALPLLGLPTGRAGGLLWIAPGAALLGGFLLSLPSGFALGSAGMAMLGGVAIASPLAIYAALLLWGERPVDHLLLVMIGLVDVLGLNAAVGRIGAGTAASTPGALAQAFAQVNSDQFTGLNSLLGGASSASLPLQPVPGLAIALLALLSLAGVFLAFVRPPTAAPEEGIPARPTILGPALLGVTAAVGFELVAVRSPEVALTGLAASVSVVALVVALVGRSMPLLRPPATTPTRVQFPPGARVRRIGARANAPPSGPPAVTR
ncbi:MAG TPA: hypothetical protein VGV89_10990 [Thermoplasmata archaeon]|nr:hypothetical protein [Thermoplasmata archaeon]